MQWKYVGSTYDDSFVLNGIDLFQEDWVSTGKTIQVKEPTYGEVKYFSVYFIEVKNLQITLVAGEFSNNVWGFYIES
ncbi:MAG: hypothetical protein ACQEV7_00895 [Bacillota bacterium]